ncbi:hypothetical protein D5S17_00475 [Pseudonocardiaceae bacterium YIM PH 21723]|nr:hypothetical protein D5S17_00475 [Pseudonocardiaceae bacterium YIM PH 21723]
MSGALEPSQWAIEQFGEHAAKVMRHVIIGLARGQQAARLVQAAAEDAGAGDRRAYGSMWATRYKSVVEQFDLAVLPCYQAYKPKGASYSLAVINGRVLIPFRHATTRNVPISRARLSTKIPRDVSRENGVEPAPTLFDILPATAADPSVADVVAAAQAENLTVIYIGYVANADSDQVLDAWWGTPDWLEDDGTMHWDPERLDLSITTAQATDDSYLDLRIVSTNIVTPGFAEGDVPSYDLGTRTEIAERPSAEPEPMTPEAEDGNE